MTMMTPLPIEPMIWHLTWQSPDGARPVDVLFDIKGIQGDNWMGEIRIIGYPVEDPVILLEGCDWIQTLQHFGIWGPTMLRTKLGDGTFYWRGTDVRFEYPEWRRHRRAGWLAKLRAWAAS